MDVKHLFSRNDAWGSRYRDQPPPRVVMTPPLGWASIDGGLIDIGHSSDLGFAFDNEGPRHTVLLDGFRIANRLVTCGEWREFVDDGAYARPELWLSDGWFAVQREAWAAPLYWERDDSVDTGWSVLTLDGRRPLHDAEPVVHVSHYEADAFARWAGARLPTEFEWEAAVGSAAATTSGMVAMTGATLDLDLATTALHPRPADVHDTGIRQLFGDVWEWTASAYLPYPRFAPASGAVGEYNGKFMSGQMVLRGGSAITPAGHIRVSYRNFFPPQSRWMFGGVRLATDER
jgi:ergothioneine biosynthesis protein EgtB